MASARILALFFVYLNDIKKTLVRSPLIQLLFTRGKYQWAWEGRNLPPASVDYA